MSLMVERQGEWWFRLGPPTETNEVGIEMWQAAGVSAIFEAAWEMVKEAWAIKGLDPHELRLQRTDIFIGAPRS